MSLCCRALRFQAFVGEFPVYLHEHVGDGRGHPSPGVLLPGLALGASGRRKPCRPEPGVLDLSGLMASLLMVDGVVVMSFVTPMAFSRNFLVLAPEMFPVLAVQFCALILHRFSRG